MKETARPIPLAALADNLKRLCWIRWIVLTMQGAVLGYAAGITNPGLRFDVLIPAIALYAAANTATLWWLTKGTSKRPPVTEWEFFGHLLFDILILSVFLYFTGGSTNPFISFFLVPISISAATLPWSYTWTITGLTAVLYFLMLRYYVPVAWFSTGHTQHGAGSFNPHILGMWFNFVVSAALITYFVVRMAKALRDHDQALNKAHEDMLRNEQVVAVATLAAGTAHRLGTPLSTMAILLNDLKSEHTGDTSLNKDLTLLGDQVNRCKDTLHGLIDAAEQQSILDRQRSPAGEYFSRIVDDWRVRHPATDVKFRTSLSAQYELEHEETLDQAVAHLLDNAAESGSDTVEVRVSNDTEYAYFRVRDFGTGIPAEQIAAPGRPFVTTKQKGFGLGLFLSHATIARYQGDITLKNHDDGGAVVELRLPLATGATP